MIQLAFEPAFDPFHAAFRMLRQTEYAGEGPVYIPQMKILDVYVAEPRRCVEIRAPQQLKSAAKRAAACQRSTYGKRPSTNALFDRMSPMQDAAIETLVLQGFFDGDAFSQRKALRTEKPLPEGLVSQLRARNTADADLMSFLRELSEFPFNGPQGLKARTGLAEYRYDLP